MAVLVLRTVKGSPLTHIELDNNFLNLDAEIHQNSGDISLMQGDIANLIALSLTSGAVPPATPIQGSQWFDTTTSTLFVYDGVKWVNIGDAGTASASAPLAPNTAGDTWYDTSTNTYKVFDGSIWQALGSVASTGASYVGTPIAGSMWFNTTTQTLQVYDGTAWVDASSATYSSTTAPTNPKQGTLWFDTATETLKVYNGTVWTDSGETMPTGNVAPTNASQGDLWYDTSSGLVMVYDGAAWKASGGISFSAIAPASPTNGTQWFDTATNTLFVWNGTSWVDVGTSTAFGTTATRPASGTTGDLYFNTTTGLLELWNGTGWVTAGASKIDDLSDVDTTTTAPTSGQVLIWDATAVTGGVTGQWKPGNASSYTGGVAPASPVNGTQWFDTTTNTFKIYDSTNSKWVDTGASTPAGATGSEPTPASVGDQYFNTTTNSLMVWNGSTWLDSGSTTNSGTTANTPLPANSSAGDQYFDTTTGLMMVFDGTAWKISGVNKINDLLDVNTATNPPTVNQILVWNGTTDWIPSNPLTMSGLETARPASPAIGELYFNTTTNSLEVWNGSTWLDSGSTTKSGPTANLPAAGISTAGDTYYDTTLDKLFVFDSTGAWRSADVSLLSATFQASGQNALEIAGGTGGILSLQLNDPLNTVITATLDGRYVRTVSGVSPDATTGNAPVSLTAVETGTQAALDLVDPLSATYGGTPLGNATVWVISGDPDPLRNGKAFIYHSANAQWYEVSSFDLAVGDARYLNVNIDGLAELAGVSDTLAGINKDFLYHNGVEWVSGNPSIDNLGDVDTTTTPPTAGQVLAWNGTSSKWEPFTAAAETVTFGLASPPAITGISGDEYYVTTTGTSAGVITKRYIHNGTAWFETPSSTTVSFVTNGGAAPTSAKSGDEYYETSTGTFGGVISKGYIYDGTQWVQNTVPPKVTYSTVAPTAGTGSAGDEHYITSTGLFSGTISARYINDGTQWVKTAGGVVEYVDDLLDVDTTGKVDGTSLLMWDATKVTGGVTGQWVVTSVLDGSPTAGASDDF